MLKKIIRQCITFVGILLLTFGAYADDKELDNKLRSLLAQSGFTEQIYQFPNVMKSSIAQVYEKGLCDEESLNTINQAIELTIKPKYINQALLNDLKAKVSERQINKLLKWYSSPLGKKIVQLEINASKPEMYINMKQESDRLFQNGKRVKIAKKIDSISKGTDWAVNIEMQSKIAMLSALGQIQHKNITDSLVMIATQLEEQKIEVRPHVEKSIILWYLYTYQNLTDSELKAYVDFLKTRNAKTFNKEALNSLAYAITQVTERFLIIIQSLSETNN